MKMDSNRDTENLMLDSVPSNSEKTPLQHEIR